MKERIMEIISCSCGKVTFGTLIKKLGIGVDDLKKELMQLKLDGCILQIDNKYMLFPDNMMIGVINVSHTGNKKVLYNKELIPLSSDFFNYVLLNDTVSFTINNKGEAEITSIIDRKLSDVTCKVVANGKKKKLECFYSFLDIELPYDVMENLDIGDIIVVNVGLNDIDSHYCRCQYKTTIGHENDPNADEITIAANYGFSNNYSQKYLEEIEKLDGRISEEEYKRRRNLTELPFVTIDCDSAKDMDDAVYGCKITGGYRLYVSIADVSHFVKYATEIFNRAYELGNSCYINNTVIHMLHPILSNMICSLNPNEDKLTKTVIMDIDKDGNIVNFDICKSIIRSRKKMSYSNVDKILVDGVCPSGYEEYVDTIKILNEISMLLKDNAIKKGRTEFPSTENIKEYDEFGNVVKVIDDQYHSTPSQELIEFSMVAANTCVAEFILSLCIPSAYRNHLSASLKKVNSGIMMINEELGEKRFKFIDSSKHPSAIQGILKKLSNMEEYPILASILLRCMERAEYGVENYGHYALALNAYTHFTSPIRRLCDLLVHMILDMILDDYNMVLSIDFDKMEKFLEEACKQASRMERQADVAENEGDRLAIVKSMQNMVNQEFEALVMQVGERIRLKVNGIDCFVKYKNLSKDFCYDDSASKYYDRNNNQYLKLGARVKVILTDVNVNTRDINVDILGVIDSKKLEKKK